MRVAVLTVSDRCARGEREDRGGPAVAEAVARAGGTVVARRTIPDDRSLIEEALRGWCDRGSVDLLLTTGGTGLAPRDVTPEATRAVIEREAPGLAETMRAAGGRSTPYAALSRQVAGIRGRTLIINLPGAPGAAVEGLDAIREVLPHAVGSARGPEAGVAHHPAAHPARNSACAGESPAPDHPCTVIAELVDEPLDVAALAHAVRRPDCGAVVVFEGHARSPSGGRQVLQLEYEAYEERARPQLQRLAQETARRFRLGGVAVIHRLGVVPTGEAAVAVAVAAAHREAAFSAARRLLECVKAEVAIWKKEIFDDREGPPDAWVGSAGAEARP